MSTRSSNTKGKAVWAYTASPSRAFLVEIACASVSGTFDPAGMTTEFELRGATGAIDGPAAEGADALVAFAGLCDSAACPQAIPEISNIVASTRIPHLPKHQPDCSSPKLTTLLAARMSAYLRQVIRGAAEFCRRWNMASQCGTVFSDCFEESNTLALFRSRGSPTSIPVSTTKVHVCCNVCAIQRGRPQPHTTYSVILLDPGPISPLQ